jgi:O-antigen ligase
VSRASSLPGRLPSGLTGAALVLLALVATGFGLAASPLLAAGAVFGVAMIAATLAWPLVVLGMMLVLGPVDLAFLTGGTRGLLPALGGLDMSGIRLIGVCAGLGTFILTRRDLVRGLLAPEARWYTLFVLWGAATLAFSPDRLEGLRLLLKLTYPLLLFLIVAASERPQDIRRLADAALWGATLILLLNPFVVANGGYAVEAGQLLRVSGPGSHHNPFSFYLLTILLICVARFRTRGHVRYLWLGAVALVWMALTLTRITFLASLVAVGVAAIYVTVKDRSARALLTVVSVGLLIGALVIRGVLERTFGYLPTAGQLFSLMADPIALYNAINWQGRETLWGILWLVFVQSPLIGSGLGASTAALVATLGEGAAHNEYLRLAVDVGVGGCVLYFLGVVGWIRGVLAVAGRRDAGSVAEEFTLPALAVIAAWGVIAATDNPFDYYAPFTQYAAFLAAGAVAAGRAARAASAEAPTSVAAEPVTASLPA